MNRGVFRLVFDRRRQIPVPVAECVPAGRSGCGDAPRSVSPRPARAGAAMGTTLRPFTLILACAFASPLWANPTGAQVVSGSATFAQQGSTLTVNNSANAIIQWQSFSIPQGAATHFQQPSAASAVLNRVVGPDASQILGTLSSNGKVFLINPQGILFGNQARVDVNGLVASTLNLSNADFLAGRLNFTSGLLGGEVRNQGRITTPEGGQVHLLGADVINEGQIHSPRGEVLLAAGDRVEILNSATPAVTVEVTGSAHTATNLGQVVADSGRIGVLAATVRNKGTLNASSAVADGGRIFLKASHDAFVDGDGRIVTTGTRGGSVDVLGDRVAVMDRAAIDASGTDGGGHIRVGGGFQGKDPTVPNATVTYVGPDAQLRSDATENGDGGTTIVWADHTTRAYGRFSARGGMNGGDGGLVETSGLQRLDVRGARADTRAERGSTGEWLLDPVDITILPGLNPAYGGTPNFSPNTNSTIYSDDIIQALGTSNVTISTSAGTGGFGDITIDGTVDTRSYSGTNLLTLTADRDVTLSSASLLMASPLRLNAGGTILVDQGTLSAPSIEINLTSGVLSLTDNGSTFIESDSVVINFSTRTSNGLLLGSTSYVNGDATMPSGGGIWITGFDVPAALDGGLTINYASPPPPPPPEITITADSLSKVYGDRDPLFTYSLSGGSVGLTGSLSRDAGENVGQYSIGLGTLACTQTCVLTYEPGTLTITRRPLATWIGGSSGAWSNPANWDYAPTLANVANVAIPAGVTVSFNLSGVELDGLSSAGNLLIGANSGLAVGGSLSTAGYTQTGGLVTAGQFTASQSFAQSGGELRVSGAATLTHTPSDPLNIHNLSAVRLEASAAGALTSTGLVTADSMNLTAAAIGSESAPMRVNTARLAFQASNGSVYLLNHDPGQGLAPGPLSVSGTATGLAQVVNYGETTILTGGTLRGDTSVEVTANSPLNVNGSVISTGPVTLTAANPGDLTINGSVQGTPVYLNAPGGVISGNIPPGAIQNGVLPPTPGTASPDQQVASTLDTASNLVAVQQPLFPVISPPAPTVLDESPEVVYYNLMLLDEAARLDEERERLRRDESSDGGGGSSGGAKTRPDYCPC